MNKPQADAGSFADLFESNPTQVVRRCRVGDVFDLEVVRIGDGVVLVALDGKHEGIIDAKELEGDDGKPTVVLGSRIAARVVEVERGTGTVHLVPVSTKPIVAALAEDAPRGASGSAVVAGMRVKGKVAGVERYGVFLEFEVSGEARRQRGLVPVAELGTPRGADLRKTFPVGRELEAAVVSVDERGRIRLSVVALRAAEERQAFETYTAGEGSQAGAGDAARAGAGGGRVGSKESRGKAPGFGTLGDLLKARK
jgi:small subunit ribosomal protein S1